MGVRRAILACLVTSALTVTGAGVSAAAVSATTTLSTMVEPPGTLAPAITEPLNPGTMGNLALSGDDLPPAAGPDGILSGNRKAAQMVTRDLTDTVKLGWNPATGNIVLTGKLLHLEGGHRNIDVSWRYNSINDHRPTLSEGTQETALTVGADNSITYTAADGGTYKFVPKAGGGYTTPPGLNASIVGFDATVAFLRFDETGEINYYQKAGDVYRLTHTGWHRNDYTDRIAYAYDADGRLASITTPNGRQVTYEYQDSGNEESPSKITDQALGRTILIDYDSDGRMNSLSDADGKETLFTYTNGRLASLTDARGTRTDLSYGTDGKAAEIDYGANTTARTVHTLTPVNSTTSHLTDGDGRTTVFTFNATRQVTKVTDPLGHTSTKTFNTHDDVLTDLDALGNLTTSTYNPNNTLATITSPAGATGGTGKQVSYTYPAATISNDWLEHQPLTAKDSEGNTTFFSYEPNTERLTTINTGSEGGRGLQHNRYEGDLSGTTCGAMIGQLCKTIDGNGRTTSITYDANRNPVKITRPSPLGVVTNTFDAAGRIATSKDGKNQTATYAYDGLDRLKQIRYSATCVPTDCVTYTYDANGNQISRVDAAGTTTIAYDPQNRPTSKTTGGVTTSLTFDQASNITSYTDPTGTVNYRYDNDDRLIALAEPGGSCPATPVFPNTTKCTGFTYDNNDRRTSTRYPNGVKNTTVYDKAGRITSITATNTAAAILAKRAYTYTTHATTARDGALRKTMTTETGATTTYTYDKVRRLTSAVTGTVTEAWTYDQNDNRLTASKTGAATTYYAYNAADQLCWTGSAAGSCSAPPAGATTYTYDANGNNTKAGTPTSTWNTFNQLTSHTSGTTTPFTYAGPSNTERTSAGTTTFENGLLGLTRQTNGTTTTSFVREPDGTLISMTNSAGTFYYTADALNSTIVLTDSTQAKAATYTYDSWGRTTGTGTQAGNNRFQYIGEYKDAATALNKFGARYYDATTGRFTQPDPSNQETNRYAYAQCNPVNFHDPSGLAIGCDEVSYFVGIGVAWALIPVTSGGSAAAALAFASATAGYGAGKICQAGPSTPTPLRPVTRDAQGCFINPSTGVRSCA